MQEPIFPFSFILFFIIALSLSFLSFSFYKTERKSPQPELTRDPESHDPTIPPPVDDTIVRTGDEDLTQTRVVEVLPSDSDKWATFSDDGCDDPNPNSSDDSSEKRDVDKEISGSGTRFESSGLCPFTSSNSVMQRKIKQQYDELVKCNDSKKLTLSQVAQFTNSLVGARRELKHKADVIHRKFVITKALLCKADRSTFDRLRQQIYKLELEQKRLEEDATVYNWLQQQLKLSPAYNKMLEIGASMEKEKSCELGEIRDEFADISFEELLAQEKKDSFWQKNGKSRLCSS
ncbi:hypothetical protein SESBI_14433 [Sesbania bispinosa]|nr:hypothetical protein SESBI_14433 [Sesbania bispinosa]